MKCECNINIGGVPVGVCHDGLLAGLPSPLLPRARLPTTAVTAAAAGSTAGTTAAATAALAHALAASNHLRHRLGTCSRRASLLLPLLRRARVCDRVAVPGVVVAAEVRTVSDRRDLDARRRHVAVLRALVGGGQQDDVSAARGL